MYSRQRRPILAPDLIPSSHVGPNVDDLPATIRIKKLKDFLASLLQTKDLGPLKYFFGN